MWQSCFHWGCKLYANAIVFLQCLQWRQGSQSTGRHSCFNYCFLIQFMITLTISIIFSPVMRSTLYNTPCYQTLQNYVSVNVSFFKRISFATCPCGYFLKDTSTHLTDKGIAAADRFSVLLGEVLDIVALLGNTPDECADVKCRHQIISNPATDWFDISVSFSHIKTTVAGARNNLW